MKKITLTDLISVEALQRIQDGFSAYTGMAALILSPEGVHITAKSGFTRFCEKLTRKSDKGCTDCAECDKNGIFNALKAGHAVVYSCHAGLMDFAAPIIVEGMFLGSFIGGQVRYEEIDEQALSKTADEYGIAPEEYIRAAKEVACLSREAIEKAAVFLGEIAVGVSGMAYRNYLALQESRHMEKAAKSQADFVMNISMNLEHSMAGWFKLLEDNINKTKDEQTVQLLGRMQAEGEAMRESVRETIEYMRMSANDVELTETAYKVCELVEQIKDGISRHPGDEAYISGITVDDTVPEVLFGDEGRIGQMINRMIRELLENKTGGSLNIKLSAREVSYSTMLYITLTDTQSCLSVKEREEIKTYVENNTYQQYQEDGGAFGISFVLLLLKRMSGNISLEEDADNIVIELCLPQLKLGGSR